MNHRVQDGQVWEGHGGWTVLVVKADMTKHSGWLVHEIRTIVAPEGAVPSRCLTTVVENLSQGGMPKAGWKQLF